MKLTRPLAAVGIGAIVAAGLALVTASAAPAHTPDYGATCSTFSFDLSRYAASQPGVDAWDETIPGTPGTPDTTTPGGFEKWTWTAPHGTPSAPPPASGWHDVGKTNDTKGSTPDTILHQGSGNGSWFYFQTLPPIVTPGTPGTPDTVKHHDAVPPKANHYALTVNGAVVLSDDFSTSASGSYDFPDKYQANSWSFQVVSWDGIGNVNDSGITQPCTPPVTVVEGVPSVSVTGPTCDAPWNTISYDIPVGLSIAGYTGSGSVKAEDLGLSYGLNSWPVDVAAGYSYEGPADVSVTLVAPPSKQDCTPKPEAIVTHNSSESVDCKTGIVTIHHSTTTTDWVWNEEAADWVKGEPVTTQDADTTRHATTDECLSTTPPTKPKPTPSAAPQPHPAPQAVAAAPVSDEQLAETGSNEGVLALVLAGSAAILLLAGVTIFITRNRPRYARKGDR